MNGRDPVAQACRDALCATITRAVRCIWRGDEDALADWLFLQSDGCADILERLGYPPEAQARLLARVRAGPDEGEDATDDS